MQAYRALQGRFDPHLYPACAAGLDGVQRRSLILTESRSLGPGRYKILDGAHRASLLAGSGRQSVLVADLTRAGQQAVPCPEHETRPPTTRPHTAESKEGQWLAARVQDGLQALKACNVTYTVLKVQDDANFPLGLTAPCDVDILVGSLKRATSCLTAALAETDAPGAAHHMKAYQAGVDGNQQQIDLFDGRGRLMLKLDLHRSLPLVQAVSVKPRWIRSVLVRSLLQLSPLGFTWPRPNMSDDCAIRWLEWFAHRSNPKKQRHRQWVRSRAVCKGFHGEPVAVLAQMRLLGILMPDPQYAPIDRQLSDVQQHGVPSAVNHMLYPGCLENRLAHSHKQPRCAVSSHLAGVRCCSDSCELQPRCISICNNKQLHTPLRDSPLSTWQEAQAKCQAQGRRLCSVDELVHSACCRRGCALDTQLVWTGDRCAEPKTLEVPRAAADQAAQFRSSQLKQSCVPSEARSGNPAALPRMASRTVVHKELIGRLGNQACSTLGPCCSPAL